MKNSVVCQDVQNLLLNDESFDLVTSTEVFEH
ncbi:MAG: methyltransferase domain-containing protein, partial [Microcystis panniformis]